MNIQINQCTLEEIEWLPGVGPKTAQSIVDARPFNDVEELQGAIPPSAWLKIEEAGVTFGFDVAKAEQIESGLGEEIIIPPGSYYDGEGIIGEMIRYAEAIGKEPLTEDQKRTALLGAIQEATAKRFLGEPPIVLQEPEPMTLRRLKAADQPQLKPGASYLCPWNIRLGPGGEARLPADESAQAEISDWFQRRGMSITFAHYGPSVKVYTRNQGAVPLVLFEIVKETEDGGHSQGD